MPSREIPSREVEKELHHFPHLMTPAEEALYARVAQRIAHHEGVGVQGEGRDEDLRTGGSPSLIRTYPLTKVGRFTPSHIRLPPPVGGRTGSLMVEAATSHILNSMHRTLRSPQFAFSPIYSKKWSKRELAIASDPSNIPMSGIVTDVLFTAVMPRLYAQYLSFLTELGTGWAAIWCSQSIVQVEEEERQDELSERTGKPPPGPGGQELPAAREGSGLRAVVVEALRRGSPKSERQRPLDHRNRHANGFEAVAYTRSTILEDCIQDVAKAFQSPPTKNAGGTTIAPSTNQEKCPCSPLALQQQRLLPLLASLWAPRLSAEIHG
ncbi:hypothetical protein HOY80DRAFT_1134030 [Tuber brumale]|nr:hypothetical protein HOY80DRAFT_1134030 [Tuber brumale]